MQWHYSYQLKGNVWWSIIRTLLPGLLWHNFSYGIGEDSETGRELMEITWIAALTEQASFPLKRVLGQCSHGSPIAGCQKGCSHPPCSPSPPPPPLLYIGCQHLEGISDGCMGILTFLTFFCSCWKTVLLCWNSLFFVAQSKASCIE